MSTVAPAVRDDGGRSLAAFRRNVWWGLAGTVACVLGLVVGDWVLDPGVAVVVRVVTAVATAGTIVACGALLELRLRSRTPSAVLTAGAATSGLVAGVVPLAVGNFGLWSLAPAATISALAMFLPARRAWAVLGVAAVVLPLAGATVAVLLGERDTAHAAWMPLLMVAAFGPTTLGMLHAWQLAERLDDARRLAGELAVAGERLRFAGELHDVQGHHLQVIALKSELAARLAQADPERAAASMREVQQLARDALRETRALVQGYRRTTLDAELTNASRVLSSAGVVARVEADPAAEAGLDAAGRDLLGLVVREATTNILRHSGASRASIELTADDDGARLRISNDGVDATGAPDGTHVLPGGTGLASLAERLTAVGGRLTWEAAGDGFVVTATVAVP
ncbi:sensor histidine kinase [Myceligenerans pegani]|uniref:Histidine kinase n=1 Tax=Myceligenerans pegani TaxID=2776917 RepID=A0ABR9MYM2_9MICO|nr:histidine kinase [Myceligenerans sp. TRM 65318]MBE1876467.1 histidine kinase [Myceligenerans sp. TRM 65318]MBE3018738.1 histidine kinase [Myceligenerans sp. TRM 65318]